MNKRACNMCGVGTIVRDEDALFFVGWGPRLSTRMTRRHCSKVLILPYHSQSTGALQELVSVVVLLLCVLADQPSPGRLLRHDDATLSTSFKLAHVCDRTSTRYGINPHFLFIPSSKNKQSMHKIARKVSHKREAAD
jgi:hypothetical protein